MAQWINMSLGITELSSEHEMRLARPGHIRKGFRCCANPIGEIEDLCRNQTRNIESEATCTEDNREDSRPGQHVLLLTVFIILKIQVFDELCQLSTINSRLWLMGCHLAIPEDLAKSWKDFQQERVVTENWEKSFWLRVGQWMEASRNDGKMPAWFEGHRGCLVKDHKMIWERVWGLELMGLHHQLQVEELDLNFHWKSRKIRKFS